MDGYAVRSGDLATGQATLRVIEVITAGQVPTQHVGPGEAAQIMTGAPLPEGADAVVKVEDTQRDNQLVVIQNKPVAPGTNLMRKGASVRFGHQVLAVGLTLNGSRIGALAELGRSKILVRPRPTVAILATGDELTPIEQTPGPGQIRNSNSAMLAAQVENMGGIPVPLGIARDNRDELKTKISDGLDCDVLLLSGGVSAGTLDLVPSTLVELGVTQVFHKVEMKPGKPIWFGQRKATNKPVCHVFGLPGNPVSSLVCCELFVRAAVNRLTGIDPAIPQPVFARLEHEYSSRSDRPTYHPARLTWTADGPLVQLVPWHGSSDLCGTVNANGMTYLTGEPRQYQPGDLLPTYTW